jgi:5-methylcytosine-specific restriction enzyme A
MSGRKMPAGWDKTRARILRRDPLCRIHGPGCSLVSTEVDHVVPDGGEHDGNLAGVCHHCHGVKTRVEAAVARRGAGAQRETLF